MENEKELTKAQFTGVLTEKTHLDDTQKELVAKMEKLLAEIDGHTKLKKAAEVCLMRACHECDIEIF